MCSQLTLDPLISAWRQASERTVHSGDGRIVDTATLHQEAHVTQETDRLTHDHRHANDTIYSHVTLYGPTDNCSTRQLVR